MTVQSLSDKAISKLNTHTEDEVFLYIDQQIPIPECVKDKPAAFWKREQVKNNVQAAMRQTKVTGPTHTK